MTEAVVAGGRMGDSMEGKISPDPRLAVCSWSLQPTGLQDLSDKLRQTGMSRVQLALDPLREDPSGWGGPEAFARCGIEVVSGMFGCVGEDYSTLETIRRSGGLVPDGHWEENLRNMEATARLAAEFGLGLVTFHAGFIPHDAGSPEAVRLLGRLREAVRVFAAHGVALALETGQETAADLRHLLESLDPGSIGVNLDPANLLLYDMDDPVTAVGVLAPWIRQVHIKDALRTQVPGTWGEEVPVGCGQVDWPAFLGALDAAGYAGNFVIEREAGSERAADIRRALPVLQPLLSRS